MSSSVIFQKQLACIMETLVHSAIADISKLVDEAAAVFHFKITQSESENGVLKTKLQRLEQHLNSARKSKERTSVMRSIGIQCTDLCDYMPTAIKEEQKQLILGRGIEISENVGVTEKQEVLQVTEGHRESHDVERQSRPPEGSLEIEGLFPEDLEVQAVKKEVEEANIFKEDVIVELNNHVDTDVTKAYCLSNNFVEMEPKGQLHFAQSVPLEIHQNETSTPGETTEGVTCQKSVMLKKEVETSLTFCFNQGLQAADYDMPNYKIGWVSHTEAKRSSGLGCGLTEERDQSAETDPETLLSQNISLAQTQPHCSTSSSTSEQPYSTQKPFVCPQCGRSFSHLHVLKRHQVIHTGLRLHACGQCGKRFSLRDGLRRHQRIHTGERPHVCLFCGKRFNQRTHLKIHLSVHTGERPFTCTHCGRGFTQLHALRRHMDTHIEGSFPVVL